MSSRDVTFTTRFAPSPTGPLHLGHAYSAIRAHDLARARGGRFLLRIEDIDRTRARPEWEQAIYEDLTWLGLTWDAEPVRQSDRSAVYERGLSALWADGLLYKCICTRRDVIDALGAPQEGAAHPSGPDGLIYPGTCRDKYSRQGPCPIGETLRLDVAKALRRIDDSTLTFSEMGCKAKPSDNPFVIENKTLPQTVGDVVLSRRDYVGSYHLSVVLDDAAQGITHVVRGQDLFEATQIHVLLQAILGFPTPTYHHHRLIRDDQGKRLAKRDDARAIAKYRSEGATPQDIQNWVGLGTEPTPSVS